MWKNTNCKSQDNYSKLFHFNLSFIPPISIFSNFFWEWQKNRDTSIGAGVFIICWTCSVSTAQRCSIYVSATLIKLKICGATTFKNVWFHFNFIIPESMFTVRDKWMPVIYWHIKIYSRVITFYCSKVLFSSRSPPDLHCSQNLWIKVDLAESFILKYNS